MGVFEHEAFLSEVASYVSKHPEIAARVSDYVQSGLNEALAAARQHAVDMETIAVVLASRRGKHTDGVIRKKLETYAGRTCFNWDWFMKKDKSP